LGLERRRGTLGCICWVWTTGPAEKVTTLSSWCSRSLRRVYLCVRCDVTTLTSGLASTLISLPWFAPWSIPLQANKSKVQSGKKQNWSEGQRRKKANNQKHTNPFYHSFKYSARRKWKIFRNIHITPSHSHTPSSQEEKNMLCRGMNEIRQHTIWHEYWTYACVFHSRKTGLNFLPPCFISCSCILSPPAFPDHNISPGHQVPWAVWLYSTAEVFYFNEYKSTIQGTDPGNIMGNPN
jgi:hypothetical protein